MTISTSPVSTQDIRAAIKILDNYLSVGEKCIDFLSTYSGTDHKASDLENAQRIASVAFKSLFAFLSDGSMENCKRLMKNMPSLMHKKSHRGNLKEKSTITTGFLYKEQIIKFL